MSVFFHGRPSRGWVWATGMFAGVALFVLAWLAVRPFAPASVGFAIFGFTAVVVPLPVTLMGIVELLDPRPPDVTCWTPSKWRAHSVQNVKIGVVMYGLILLGSIFVALAD